jgi:hypothetical protein
MANINIHSIYRPFLLYFRTKRMKLFQEKLNPKPESFILDVGGTPFNWSLLPDPPMVILLNISMPSSPKLQKNFQWVVADARKLPFKGDEIEIVYSNSVIEHLGDIDSQKEFAEECRRVGCQYFIQTPNRKFPIEPHYIAPFIHWLPREWRKRLARNFTLWGWVTRPSKEDCDSRVNEIRLLDETEIRMLFSDAEILYERTFGLVKSIIAIGMGSKT